ncbi:MAG: hypothetical protein JW889_10420 [Verrucomicrobia bacterium]|nr:hypothetical protein [Verrucomicrobiota bacterium]
MRRWCWAAGALGVLVVLVCAQAAALPLLTQRETIEGLVIYPDEKDSTVYYYVPGEVRLAMTDGTPQFSFRRMRYTGTRLLGDQGTFRGRGDISFTVVFAPPGDAVRKAQDMLKRLRSRRAVLLPIPVESIEAELVYTIIEGDEAQRGERLATGLWAEPPKEPPKEGPSAGQWGSKSFDIALNPRTTQVMWEAYEKGGVLLSLNYAVIARGVSDLNVLPAEAQRRLDALRRQAEAEGAAYEEPAEIVLEQIARTVRADALQIRVSPTEHEACFTSVDIDAEMPAGYVFLDVYCYDFQNDPQSAVAKKRVEIRGHGIAGGRPKVKVEFNRGRPSETVHGVRFDLAVDLDRGFDYRIVEFDDDGNVTAGDWIAVPQWSGMLDVSREIEPPTDNETDETPDE